MKVSGPYANGDFAKAWDCPGGASGTVKAAGNIASKAKPSPSSSKDKGADDFKGGMMKDAMKHAKR